MRQAYEQLFTRHLIQSVTGYESACRRLIAFTDKRLTWDFLVKMSNDLDAVLFHSDLRYRALLKCKST